jgi:hypothetical protein
MCMEEVNNIYSVVLGNVKGRGSVKRNQYIKTDTLNTFCETRAVFKIFHCFFSLVLHAVYYVMLFH